MSVDHSEIWVTSVVQENDVSKALVLSSSLKRVYTTRKQAVIVSPTISDLLGNKLYHGFDFVFRLEESLNKSGANMDLFAKIYPFRVLHSFKKCCYMSPSMMAIKNCDDIFAKLTDDIMWLEDTNCTSMYLFKPSILCFETLLVWLSNQDTKDGEAGILLRKWSQNQFKCESTISNKYYREITNDMKITGQEQEICVVNLPENPYKCQDDVNRRPGIFEKAVLAYWEKIQVEIVLPMINSTTLLKSPDSSIPLTGDFSQYDKEPIAIVGMSCRYPGANDLTEFWSLIFGGMDGTSSPPAFRWLREQCSRQVTNSKNTNAGFLKVPVDEFDAKFFGISPKEVLFMDPQHRLLHELVWEGLEDACIDPHTLRGTSGSVFMGSWMNDYKDIIMHSGNDEFYRTYMGNSIGAAAARISFLLGMTGPSIATESGCSSAIVAVHLACRALQNGETNLALACGVNLLLHPFDKDVMPMVISPDGHCKTFSEDANGFARAEGGGVLVLKRLSDALNNGDLIWGLIRGSAVSQEGVSKSMGTPTVYCESLAMKEALRDANVLPEDISYVETHGTGTTVGDPMEVSAIAAAYNSPNRKEPLIIGSVKTNVGHTESCSGITGIMKVILAMHHRTIPAHINFSKLNQTIDLHAIPAIIPLEPLEWKATGENTRIAGVSSFGITGTDAHVIVQESSQYTIANELAANEMERPLHLLKLSAKTEDAMNTLLGKFKEFISGSNHSFTDISFSANTGRSDFPIRAAIVSKNNENACSNIENHKFLKGEMNSENMGKICFLFTGQGSQYPGMAKRLYETSPVFRMHFDYCEKILVKMLNISIAKMIWCDNQDMGEQVNRTIVSQTSIFCIEYALLKMWEAWGVKPDYVLGHSLGEFAAAVCAGILLVEDAIKLVAERSRLIDEISHGKMLVIKASKQQVEHTMKSFIGEDKTKALDYAAINSDQQTVVAGDPDVIHDFSQYCCNRNIKCILLAATHAFHSRHMDSILDKYGTIAKQISTKGEKNCGYISGMRGDFMERDQIDARYWVQHTREKVNFMDASKKAVELGCRVFIEIGPQPVLSALTVINNDENIMCVPSLKKNQDDWSTLLDSLGRLYVSGVKINWKGFDQFYARNKVRLPHYPFIGKKFWPDVIQTSGQVIHPLVGSLIPNASTTKLFQIGLNLRSHEYIKDHSIGQTVIFPGAGYLEMCLAAGLAMVDGSVDCLNKPSRSMKVENLEIKAPLALDESKTCQIQTVVGFNSSQDDKHDWNDVSIKIFHRLESDFESKWLSHATATFFPVLTDEDTIITANFCRETFTKTLQNPCEEDAIITEVYQKLAIVGLNFGPTFRSLEKLWKNDDGTLLAKVKCPSDIFGQPAYILHPVILDAMIQAIMMPKLVTHSKKKLFVPIKVGKFLWFSKTESESLDRYILVSKVPQSKDENFSALLLDSTGQILAVMMGVEYIDTTVKTVESVIEQQSSSMPEMWDEIWRPQIGPLQYTHDLKLCTKEKFYSNEFYNYVVEKYDKIDTNLLHIFHSLEDLVYCNILKSMYQCGFKPILNTLINESDLMAELKILESCTKIFGYFLHVLEEEKILMNICAGKWKVTTAPPTYEEIEYKLSSSDFTVKLVNAFRPTLLFMKVGENLSSILQGKQSALNILFPEDQTKKDSSSVGDFYVEYGKLFGIMTMAGDIAEASLKHCKQHAGEERTIMRICEIGAGTGSLTEAFLEMLNEIGVEYEYMYTDISTAFFPAAEKRFEKYLKHMTFKRLNIEEDPITQGFVPAYYDHIVAFDVIHATRDLKEALANIKMILKPGGRFDMIEMTRVNRFLTYLFGLLDGFWRFQDVDLRSHHCTLPTSQWLEVLEISGFKVIETFPCVNQHHSFICSRRKFDSINLQVRHMEKSPQQKTKTWVMFHQEGDLISNSLIQNICQLTDRKIILVLPGSTYKKIEGCWNEFTLRKDNESDFVSLMSYLESFQTVSLEGIIYCWTLDKTSDDQDNILKPFFYLAKSILGLKHSTGLRVIVVAKGIAPLENNDLSFFHMSTVWGFLKSLQNERIDLNCRCVDIGDNNNEKNSLQIFYEIWNNGKEAQIAYQGTTRYIPKVSPLKPALSDLSLPSGCNRFQLVLPETKSISDLKFGPLDKETLASSEIEIQVKASALNFKDVLNVLKPSEEFEDSNAVGFDFAGVIKRVHPNVVKWRVGDKVFGVNVHMTALPSHLRLHEDEVLQVPDDMTLSEACTLPAVVVTSYHCLIDVAKIKSCDTVLIHAASGGVGISAIEICKHVGATIIATAGSKRKRTFLRSLGIQHVFHSRNTDYGQNILDVTKGRGVDVVLNSLTSDGFKEATLKACAYGANFVEMSKLSIWQPEEISMLRPDIQYTIVDVSKMKSEDWQYYMKKLKDMADAKVIRPIPYVRFNAVNIREALYFLQKAKHIGKVVCTMPEIRHVEGKTTAFTPMFNSNSTYLITGGLGGVGFEVCKWMVENEAKYIILAGRSPPSSYMKVAISSLNSEHNSKIDTVQLDVSCFEECKNLVESKIPEMGYPILRGIMHAAGTLHDGLIENQTWENLSSTFKTKVKGTLNFHELTKDNSRLEHFVLFSSIAALFGAIGQSNHSAGNHFEDTFAQYRNSIGLPATSINWGQWGEVGVATEVDLPGLKPFSNLQGIKGLEYVLKSQRTQTAVINIESFVMLSKLYPHISSYLDERVWKNATRNSSGPFNLKSEDFWKAYDSMDGIEGKLGVVKEKLRFILRNVLKLEETDSIDDAANLQDLGVDSLMFVEIKNSLQTLLGDRVTVSANVLRDSNNILLLSQTLVRVIEGVGLETHNIPSATDVNDLIKEDCELPDHVRSQPGHENITIDKVSNVLLTGVTGVLGPYILRELSKYSQIKRIFCLIRPTRDNSAKDRLIKTLQMREIISDVDMNKVECISGNIAMPKLGMETESWNHLCDNTDAVFHCAASVQHMEVYRKDDDPKSMRAVNIGGLKNVLEFCCTGKKLKQVYNASTLVAVANIDKDGNLSESWPEQEDYDNVTYFAYPVTKFVCDVLMKEAITKRGIPGKVFRLPLISGDSKTGRFVLEQNHFMLRYIFIMKNEIMANNPFPVMILPVDICAEISVNIFLNPEADDDIYNIVNCTPDTDQAFAAIAARFGYNVDIVDFEEFSQKVRNETTDNSPMSMFKDFYANQEDLMSLYNNAPALKQWVVEGSNKSDFFMSKKVAKIVPDFYNSTHGQTPTMEYIHNDLLFAKQQGWLQKFGL